MACLATPCHPDRPPEGTPRPPALSPWPSPLPPAPPPLRHCAPHGTPRHQGLAPCWWLPWRDPDPPHPRERRITAIQGPPSYITRNYPQPVGCPARARIIFVMQNAGLWWSRPRPPRLSGCAGSRCAARSRLPRLPPVRPRRGLPKSRRWWHGEPLGLMKSSYKALTWNTRKQKANPEGLAKCLILFGGDEWT